MAHWDQRPRFAPQRFDAQSGAALLSAHYGPERLAAFRACRLPAMASDYFRAHAALALGGLYVDTGWVAGGDFVANLAAAMETGAGGLFFALAIEGIDGALAVPLAGSGFVAVLNGLFWVAPGLPLMEHYCRLITCNIEARLCEELGFVTGVVPLSLLIGTAAHAEPEPYFALLARGAAIDPSLAALLAAFERYCRAESYAAVRAAARQVRLVDGAQLPGWFRRRDIGQKRANHWSHHQGSIFQP